MAATMVTNIACTVVVCMLVVITLKAGDVEAITCGQVVNNLTPCLGYLKTGKGLDSKSCDWVKAVNGLAQTTAHRKTACSCIKNASATYGIGAGSYTASLPGACGVCIPYKISRSTD